MRRTIHLLVVVPLVLAGCAADTEPAGPAETTGPAGHAEQSERSGPEAAATTADFSVTEHGTFDEGWAMSFLPGGEHLLVTERGGALRLRDQASGEVREVAGAPEVEAAGQGGMHDVIPGPTFAEGGAVYLSWVRDHPDGAQGVVGRAELDVDAAELSPPEVIWEQDPASGSGHFALRLLVSGEHLYVTSGDRQEKDPAQDTGTNLGKVVRLTLDGRPAPGNPWAGEGGAGEEAGAGGEGGAADQLWTTGHRNPLGIAEDASGAIWVSEMGPQGGDELNLLAAGENYGWPEASMGVHYGGGDIPDHAEGDGFRAPAAHWVPSISPGSLLIYRGDRFPDWRGDALLGGLSGRTLVRVELDGDRATIAQEWDMGERIRALAEAPDGAIWVLEDGAGGRLLELTPR